MFEWDEAKRKLNLRKHGIDFVDVPAMFERPMLVRLDDRIDYGEERWLGVGLLDKGIVAVVAFTEPKEDVVRIISVRKAVKHEREGYQKEIPH